VLGDGLAPRVIQAPQVEHRSMRYELTGFEWAAIKPVLPNRTNRAAFQG
jgi:hypothetical protein